MDKYNVLVDSETINRNGPMSLREATELVKILCGRFTLGAHIASSLGDEEKKLKNLSSMDSIEIVKIEV